jgi:diguanylate cyclase (GGDEF)-like protein
LKLQALAFALCIGAVAFLLTSFNELRHGFDPNALTNSLIVALACGVLSWGAADRMIKVVSTSINAAVGRITAAAQGDLDSPAPDDLADALPNLSESIDSLFAQVRSDIESANTLALFDPVTALPNRVHFRNETEATLAAMNAGDQGALFFIDLDHFKAVNDTHGHAAGDQLLIMIANRLRSIMAGRNVDKTMLEPVVGRLAGDEFTAFLPQTQDRQTVVTIADRLLSALSDPFTISGQTVNVGASIGIAMWPDHGRALTDLMRAADVAMYASKEGGRNQFQFFSSSMAEELAKRVELDHELRTAIEEEQFGFHLQPQIDVSSGRVISNETLLRWYHPSGEIRLPHAFMRATEQAGLMPDVGQWAFAELARMCGRWATQGLDQRISINLNLRQLEQPGFFKSTAVIFAEHNAPLSMLEIEVSERLAMESGEIIGRELAKFRDAGATVTIDNFGRGFSNINRLRALPVDRVKLDASLTRDIVNDPEARAIVHSYVNMLHGIGREVVAEGIESDAQIRVLKVIGCNAVQGYAVAKPMDEKKLAAWRDRRAAKKAA